ncbi:hypothetical protein ACI2KT_14255 [Ensifer adhaerens]|uniref:hypothetical protein n=1 Tax=Ensifer adhaerens TaxID=106592 RepID=UPI00384E0FDB
MKPEIGPFGFNCGKSWQSHAWVECGDFIVDITADQFGAPPVLVVDRTDNRYNKGNRDGRCQSSCWPAGAPWTTSGRNGKG